MNVLTPTSKNTNSDDSSSKQKIIRKQNYRDEWEQDKLFRLWLSRSPDGRNAFCNACNCTILPRHASLMQHRKANKHLTAMRKYEGDEEEEVEEETKYKHEEDDDDLDLPSDRFLKILKDISSLEENMFGESNRTSPHKSNNGDSDWSPTNDVNSLIRAQSETNTLLHALINIQKERLAIEKEKLETTKIRAEVEEQILALLNDKL